jgi:hypothetical protein
LERLLRGTCLTVSCDIEVLYNDAEFVPSVT